MNTNLFKSLICLLIVSRGETAPNTKPSQPVVSLDAAGAEIFPQSWQSATVNAQATLLDRDQRKRSHLLVARCLSKYPAEVLRTHLQRVYVVGRLAYNGVPTGGPILEALSISRIQAERLMRRWKAFFMQNFPASCCATCHSISTRGGGRRSTRRTFAISAAECRRSDCRRRPKSWKFSCIQRVSCMAIRRQVWRRTLIPWPRVCLWEMLHSGT